MYLQKINDIGNQLDGNLKFNFLKMISVLLNEATIEIIVIQYTHVCHTIINSIKN